LRSGLAGVTANDRNLQIERRIARNEATRAATPRRTRDRRVGKSSYGETFGWARIRQRVTKTGPFAERDADTASPYACRVVEGAPGRRPLFRGSSAPRRRRLRRALCRRQPYRSAIGAGGSGHVDSIRREQVDRSDSTRQEQDQNRHRSTNHVKAKQRCRVSSRAVERLPWLRVSRCCRRWAAGVGHVLGDLRVCDARMAEAENKPVGGVETTQRPENRPGSLGSRQLKYVGYQIRRVVLESGFESRERLTLGPRSLGSCHLGSFLVSGGAQTLWRRARVAGDCL
jgi:hypothetical protein